MKTNLASSKKSPFFLLAPSLLLLATASVARADGDLIDYRDTVRYYDELTTSRSVEPAGVRIAYLRLERRQPATRVIVRDSLPKPAARDGGYFISYPAAEATGAAQGQTVNRATNNLD